MSSKMSSAPIALSQLQQYEVTGEMGSSEKSLLGISDSNAMDEISDADVDSDFDQYEVGGTDKLRLLDNFSMYTGEGKRVPLESLDLKKAGASFIAYGTVVEPIDDDVKQRLALLHNKTRGRPGSCIPLSGSNVLRILEGENLKNVTPIKRDAEKIFVKNTKKRKLENGHTPKENARAPASEKKKSSPEHSSFDKDKAVSDESQFHIGNVMRSNRSYGLIFYYDEECPRQQPMEYEAVPDTEIERDPNLEELAVNFNRKELTIGSRVDTFCLNTFKWYGSRIMGTANEGKLVRIHYNKWKAKYDEDIDRYSFRLAPPGSRSASKTEHTTSFHPPMGRDKPWSCLWVPSRKTKRVKIDKILDWCIDFSVPLRPLLWLVSEHAWYLVKTEPWWDRVCPHPLYAATFSSTNYRFQLISAFVRCLQLQPHCSLKAMTRKVQANSGKWRFNSQDLLENHKFILEQLESMGSISVQNADGKMEEVNIMSQPFVSELRTIGEEWEKNGGQLTVPFTLEGRENKRLSKDSVEVPLSLDLTPKDNSTSKTTGQSVDRLPEKKRIQGLRRYPIPDSQLWVEEQEINKISWPEPTLPTPYPPSITGESFGNILGTWAFLQLFGELMDAPTITLQQLVNDLAGTFHVKQQLIGNNCKEVQAAFQNYDQSLNDDVAIPSSRLARLHISLLNLIICDEAKKLGSSKPTEDTQLQRSVYFDGAADNETDFELGDMNRIQGAGGGRIEANDVSSEMMQGLTETTLLGLEGVSSLLKPNIFVWVEATRLLIINRENIFQDKSELSQVLKAKYLDPLGECRRILNHLLKSMNNSCLEKENATDIQGDAVKLDLASTGDVPNLVAIMKRIDDEFYDCASDGHALVAQHVAQFGRWIALQENDENETAAISEQLIAVNEFQNLYDAHVLRPLEILKSSENTWKQPDASCGWAELVKMMGEKEYDDWSAHARVQVLCWLCDQALSTDTVREVMERTHMAREAVMKREKDIAKEVRQTLEVQGGIERLSDSDSLEHGPGRRRGRRSVPKQIYTKEEIYDQILAKEDEDMRIQRQLSLLTQRLEPLGEDRKACRYWLIHAEETDNGGYSGQIFVESNDGSCWHGFNTLDGFLALHKWLDPRGLHEYSLRQVIRQLLLSNGLVDIDVLRSHCHDDEIYYTKPQEVVPSKILLNASMDRTMTKQQHVAITKGCSDLCIGKTCTATVQCFILKKMKMDVNFSEIFTVKIENGTVLVNDVKDAEVGVQENDHIVAIDGKVMSNAEVEFADFTQKLNQERESHTIQIIRTIHFEDSLSMCAIGGSNLNIIAGILLNGGALLIHPYSIGNDWISSKRYKEWQEKILNAVSPRDISAAILEIESALSKQKTVLNGDNRWQGSKRRKWIGFVSTANTCAQLYAAWGALEAHLDLMAAKSAWATYSRRSFMQAVPVQYQNMIPDVGEHVVYFGDGHVQAMNMEKESNSGPMWGGELPRKDVVCECKVVAVKYWAGGINVSDSNSRQPFATLTLQVIAPESADPDQARIPREPFGLKPACNPKAKLNRLLRRCLIPASCESGSAAFLQPVDTDEYPDYKAYVSKPMDLGTMWHLCLEGRYTSPSEFEEHLKLVLKNCHTYCDSRFPGLSEDCDRVIQAALDAFSDTEFNHKIQEAYQQSAVLGALWNKHMGDFLKDVEDSNEASYSKPEKVANGKQPRNKHRKLNANGLLPEAIRQAQEAFFDALLPICYESVQATSEDKMAKTSSFENGHQDFPREFVVTMRLHSSFPLFCVPASMYMQGFRAGWRQEEYICILKTREEDDIDEGIIVGIKQLHASGYLCWECLEVELDVYKSLAESDVDSSQIQVISMNPWQLGKGTRQ